MAWYRNSDMKRIGVGDTVTRKKDSAVLIVGQLGPLGRISGAPIWAREVGRVSKLVQYLPSDVGCFHSTDTRPYFNGEEPPHAHTIKRGAEFKVVAELAIPADVRVWQDSPEYGCDDNPSYKWYAQRSVDGHIVSTSKACDTQREAVNEVARDTRGTT